MRRPNPTARSASIALNREPSSASWQIKHFKLAVVVGLNATRLADEDRVRFLLQAESSDDPCLREAPGLPDSIFHQGLQDQMWHQGTGERLIKVHFNLQSIAESELFDLEILFGKKYFICQPNLM